MPLKKSSSPAAFKSNVRTEMHAGKPQKQALAIAYSTMRANRKGKKLAKGGYAAEPTGPQCPVCDQSMEVGHSSECYYMAEGGAVDDLRPAHANQANRNYEEQVGDGSAAPGPDRYETESSEDNSDDEQDLPRQSESLSLVDDIMTDRKRRAIRMADGGMVENENRPSGKRRSMDTYSQGGMAEYEGAKPDQTSKDTMSPAEHQEWLAHQGPKYSQGGGVEPEANKLRGSMDTGSLHGSVDEPTDSYMDNDGDEMGSFDEDGRDSRGMNISQVQTMSDDEHPGMNSDSDASLVDQILQERKARRRNKY